MSLKKFDNYQAAEEWLSKEIILRPDFVTATTLEILGTGFILTRPDFNTNDHSNYDYAEKFFRWILTGEKELSVELLQTNPWVKRFVDGKGLPESFSATYGWKIKNQLPIVIEEILKHRDSRRGYVNILLPEDKQILQVKTTHEFPCTIGVHFIVREDRLNMIVNMRSNNVCSVMPYDVYNFTELLQHVARETKLDLGYYYHQINSAHIFKGDARRLKELFFK